MPDSFRRPQRHDRSVDGGRYRAALSNVWAGTAGRKPSSHRASGEIFVERSDGRRPMVRALGRKLRLRNEGVLRAETVALTARGYCQRAVSGAQGTEYRMRFGESDRVLL